MKIWECNNKLECLDVRAKGFFGTFDPQHYRLIMN